MDESRFRATLAAFLAECGGAALIALALAGAELVLPLFEDDRLRRALRPPRRQEELDYAKVWARVIWLFHGDRPFDHDAAAAVYFAADLPVW